LVDVTDGVRHPVEEFGQMQAISNRLTQTLGRFLGKNLQLVVHIVPEAPQPVASSAGKTVRLGSQVRNDGGLGALSVARRHKLSDLVFLSLLTSRVTRCRYMIPCVGFCSIRVIINAACAMLVPMWAGHVGQDGQQGLDLVSGGQTTPHS